MLKKNRSRFLLIFLGAVTAIAAPNSPPISPKRLDQILCPAELLVLRSDTNKYFTIKTDTPIRRGLEKKIGSALSTLPILCKRYAASEIYEPTQENKLIDDVKKLRSQFTNRKRSELESNLNKLIQNASFNTEDFLFDQKGDRDEQAAKDTYEQYCHGCHATSILTVENPAYSLKQMAKTLPRQEFLARMLLGIRGTPEVGLSNPLTVSEIGAMTRFLIFD